MASTVLFLIMTVLAVILLLVSSIASILGAINLFASSDYNNNSNIRSAHQYLTISASLGISSVVTLILVLIIAALTGGFSYPEISEATLQKSSVSQKDLVAAYKGEKELSSGQTMQIIVLVILIIVAIIALITGILAAMAAVQISNSPNRDAKVSSAYTESIIAAVAGIGGIGVMIVAVISYFGIRKARAKKLQELEAFTKSTEEKLGVKPTTTP